MTTLTLPISPSALSAIIAAEWQGERGVARLAGVDPESIRAETVGAGYLNWTSDEPVEGMSRAVADRALLSLADALEARGLVVDREGGVRVKGWAAEHARGVDFIRHDTVNGLVRIIDLPPSDPRRSAHDSEVLRARLARAEAARGPVGSPGTRNKGEMKMGGGR